MFGIGNLHPLLFMTPKEVRAVSRLMEMLDEHTSASLLTLNDKFDFAKIDNAYSEFQTVLKKLQEKLQEISQNILVNNVGLRSGMIVKIFKEGTDSASILKINSLHLSNASPLSSAPNQWVWRIIGHHFNPDDLSAQQMAVEYVLSGNLSIERLALNGIWLPVIQYQHTTRTSSAGKKKLAR